MMFLEMVILQVESTTSQYPEELEKIKYIVILKQMEKDGWYINQNKYTPNIAKNV